MPHNIDCASLCTLIHRNIPNVVTNVKEIGRRAGWGALVGGCPPHKAVTAEQMLPVGLQKGHSRLQHSIHNHPPSPGAQAGRHILSFTSASSSILKHALLHQECHQSPSQEEKQYSTSTNLCPSAAFYL